VLYRDCPECCGGGYQPATFNWATLEPCDVCNGTGRIEVSPDTVVAAESAPTPLGALEESLRGRLPAWYAN
jgi:hypothetical protein